MTPNERRAQRALAVRDQAWATAANSLEVMESIAVKLEKDGFVALSDLTQPEFQEVLRALRLTVGDLRLRRAGVVT